jgi:hypothetical protein
MYPVILDYAAALELCFAALDLYSGIVFRELRFAVPELLMCLAIVAL